MIYKNNSRTIKDIYQMFTDEALVVDESYQRRSIWGEADKIRLVETVLLKLIIPELFFWKASTDPDTGESIVHIVDGQQRINALIDFINGNFKLKEQSLLEEDSKVSWGNKFFNDLSSDDKTSVWNYPLMVIEIAQEASRADIVKMFRRLNLTDYNLNDQERRNSIQGEFAALAKELSENSFWERHKLFNNTDIKRMKDVEFCASIILLCKEGIIDQTDQKPLNTAYEDLQVDYKTAKDDKEKILRAISLVEKFISKVTINFLKRKAQLYTLFSLIFDAIGSGMDIGEKQYEQFRKFVPLYVHFDNNYALPVEASDEEKVLFDLLKQYKLASSEGLNKHTNRMIRFTVLKTFLFSITNQQMEKQMELLNKLKKHSESKK